MIDDLKVETKKLQKMANKLRDNNIKEVSFELVVGSLFPQALKNIKDEMR